MPTFYSQCGQDEFLETNVFKGFKNGVFMDIGAHDGISINNTLFFEKEHQWTGVNVEANKKVYDRLCVNRPTCTNLHCAASSTDGTVRFVQNEGYTEMLSGIVDNLDQRHVARIVREIKAMGGSSNTVSVPSKRIETICDEHNIKHIHYLSIDVEGGEFDVIKSINFDKVFIDVIDFENNYNDVSAPIVNYLISKGYCMLKYSADIFMIHKDSQFKVSL